MGEGVEEVIEMECGEGVVERGVWVGVKRWKVGWVKGGVEVGVRMKGGRVGGEIVVGGE